tara:strand:+ start:6825 stop:8090 length:1266 start_codon:yes stop_codon:yes gene_type:complete
MRIAIIGSGGREHAICHKIYNSKKVDKIFCLPGNGGTHKISKNVDIDLKNFIKIKEFLINENIDITIVGPEDPLVNGIVDYLNLNGLKVFGPDKFCSNLEGSKIFTKKICNIGKIPTANFKIFKDVNSSLAYLQNKNFPIVVKADGLAAGKGVYICEDFLSAKNAVEEIFNGKFGKAEEVLVEEFLNGEEMSFFIIYDNSTFKTFNTAQDHKKIFEKDKGKNTGGMGAYSPSRLINYELEEKIINKIIIPTLDYLKKNNGKYVGFLYAGLMIKDNEPYLIEFNVRMGDPECQTILPLLKNDFIEIVEHCLNGTLNQISLDWKDEKSICIVLSSKGYPDEYKKNISIENLGNLQTSKSDYIFHAGTKFLNNKYISTGGRVLNFVSVDKTFKYARENSLRLIQKLNWKNGHYRKDIAHKVIDS